MFYIVVLFSYIEIPFCELLYHCFFMLIEGIFCWIFLIEIVNTSYVIA